MGRVAVGRNDDGGVEAGERAGGEINRRLGGTRLDETTEAAKPVLRSCNGQASHSEFVLNADQQKASDEIQTAFGKFQPFLLYGITGSGKTEVYFDAMAKVLAQGRQVLFLLPEINLTPQLLKRVEDRFADVPTAVLHSQMAAGKRTQDYLRAMLGQAKLVIGTRLAVFTPLPDVGLIVVDEEHDGSFKQDNELRYHARDLAVWRAKQSGCPIVWAAPRPAWRVGTRRKAAPTASCN